MSIEPAAPVARTVGWAPLLPALHGQADGALKLEGDGFEAWVSADRRSGWVRQAPELFPLGAVVRVLLGESLLARGGLLVHGVALAHEGRGALFTGHSGAGKSTLGRWGSAGGLRLLADELVAVLPDGEGFRVHGTPWNAGGPGDAALGMIGLLVHAGSAQLTPIEPSLVLRELLSNVLEPAASAVARAQLFRIASRLLAAVPAKHLAFAPNLEVAHALTAALAR